MKFSKKIIISVSVILIFLSLYIYWIMPIPIDKPTWRVGDWFDINISRKTISKWSKISTTMPTDRFHFEIIDEMKVFGYQCFVIKCLWVEGMFGKQDSTLGSTKYFIDKLNLSLIAVEEFHPVPSDRIVSDGIVAWDKTKESNLMSLPLFPIRYKSLLPLDILTDMNCPPQSNIQKACFDIINIGDESVKCDKISSGNMTYRWVPGQIWWAQAWSNIPDENGMTFRASLAATSKDGKLNYPLP